MPSRLQPLRNKQNAEKDMERVTISGPRFVDLFSGCGGLSLGFERAGFRSALAVDAWPDALQTYVRNRPGADTLCADLSDLDIEEVCRQRGLTGVDVVVGGPPCQGFSVAGKRREDDQRNRLYQAFVRWVEVLQPRAFLMENVPNIFSFAEGRVLAAIVSDFERLGYRVEHRVVTASDYGVPQRRRRAVFVGLRNGLTYRFPERGAAAEVTTRQALGDLPEATIAEGGAYTAEPQSAYQEAMRLGSLGVHNHLATVHTRQTASIIAQVPDGGCYKDLPEALQQTRRVHIAWTRMNSNRPCFTIDCGHNHHFHYEYNRVPTVRESARIQSFPDSFVFAGNHGSQLRQVGNAVPPLMAYALARNLMQQL